MPLLPCPGPVARAVGARCLSRWITRAFLFLGLLLATLLAAPPARAEPVARQGQIDLRGVDWSRQGAVELKGEWAFRWRTFVDPARAAQPSAPGTAWVTAPGPWNDITADGKPAGSEGHGSYWLDVQCDSGRKLALLVPAQRTAMRLYINGELAANQGEPGAEPAGSRAAIRGRATLTSEASCPMRVVAHLSNHEHRAGAFVRAISVGPMSELAQQRQQRLTLDAALLGAFLVMGLVPIIFFAARPHDPTPLLFGLFCFALAIYADMTGERALLQLVASEWPWEAYLKLEYLSWFAVMALFPMFAAFLFPRQTWTAGLRALQGLCAAGALTVLLTGSRTFSQFATAGQVLSLLSGGFVLVVVARAALQRRSGAWPFLLGMVILLAVIVLDFVVYSVGRSTASFTPAAILVIALLPAMVLARRLARSLNTEELRAAEQREKAALLVRATREGVTDWDSTRSLANYSQRLRALLGPGENKDRNWPLFEEFIQQAMQLEQRNAELREHVRLREEVERMSRHDIKTPLNTIISVPRLLRDEGGLNPGQTELLGMVERAGYRVLEMVNLSLDLYKMESGGYVFRPRAVNVVETVSQALDDLRAHARAKSVELQLTVLADGAVHARAEELLCYSMVANLVKNAVEAAPAGSIVTLSVAGGDPVTVLIHNDGAVPADIHDRFFDKYVTSGKTGGTGLGTYSARLMAQVQGGDVRMSSTQEQGTTLAIILRAPDGDTPVPPPAGSPPPASVHPLAPRMRRHRILVVDDDEYNRLIIRRYLPATEFEVDTAINGQGALNAVDSRWPDMVLIDMEMPIMGGIEAVVALREREAALSRRPIPIVMMSSNDDPSSRERGLDAGCARFLVKPVSRETLLATIDELLGTDGPPSVASPEPVSAETATSPDDVVLIDPDLAPTIPGFLDSRRAIVAELAQALARDDRAEVRRLAHRLTGSLALYGFRWAAQHCRAIEQDSATAAPEELAARIASLAAHLEKVRTAEGPAQA